MSAYWMQSAEPWAFDLISALIGAAFSAGIAVVVYMLRERISGSVQAAKDEVSHARDRLAMTVQQRYTEWIAARAGALHILREGPGLADLYVAPELITPLPAPARAGKDQPPPTISIGTALQAAPRLIVTGAPGSGRTAFLGHLATVFAADTAAQAWGLDDHRLPIYVHLGELALDQEAASTPPPAGAEPADPKKVPAPPDPSRPLVDAVVPRVPLLMQPGVPGLLRETLKKGQAIVLLDGLEELEPENQARAFDWIKTFSQANPEVHIVMAGALNGNAPLLEAGFVSMRIAPWTAAQVGKLAERWMHEAKGSAEDAVRLGAILKPTPGTSPLPLDVMLSAFVWSKCGSIPPNLSTLYGQAVDAFLPSVEAASPLSKILATAVLTRLALTLLKENRSTATRAEIENLVIQVLPQPAVPSAGAATPAAPVAAAPPAAAPATGTETPPAEGQPPAADAAGATTPKPPEPAKPKGVPESVEALLKCGLLAERRKDAFAFAHPRIQAYLAARQITVEGAGALLAQHLEDQAWSDVLELCAGMVNIAPLIDVILKRDADLFRSRLWMVARWASSAGPDVAWRGKVLAKLAEQFMAPNQFPPIRERALMGLLSTQDKGLPYLFKQGLGAADADIRALAAKGLGMLGREADLATLQMALQDSDEMVRQSAVRAMGTISGQTAIEHLATILLEAEESLRREAAVVLAGRGQEGHRLLQEASREEDMLVRRATTYGLAATGQHWAREILTTLEHDDPQWFVRSAATEALALMKGGDDYAPDCSPIALDQQGWLVEWGAARGMSVGLGRSAEPILMKAMNEGEPPVRMAAMYTLAHLGREASIEPIQKQLESADPELRMAAFRSLEFLSEWTGKPILRK